MKPPPGPANLRVAETGSSEDGPNRGDWPPLRLLCVAGASGTGKTTLLERLLESLPIDRGRVALIKHTHHELSWHPPAKDSTRFAQAGAGAVVVIDPAQIASFTRARRSPARDMPTNPGESSEGLDRTRRLLDACATLPESIELVLAEGWMMSLVPKVLITDDSKELPPLDRIPEVRALIAVESETLDGTSPGPKERAPGVGSLPVYARDDVAELAARIWQWAEPVSALREAAGARQP
ncbi:MAG: molybdopterin-guanine dinucleotide biosynthesis protein MobB [Gemmatimonadota bacterium]